MSAVNKALALLVLVFVVGCSGRAPVRTGSDSALVGGLPSLQPRLVDLTNRTNCGADDTAPPNRGDTKARVAALIAEMERKGYQAYIIPTADQHQSEYAPAPDRRREYISGFTGSSGVAIVLRSGHPALWTDGRYFTQADNQLDCDWVLMKEGLIGVPSMVDYLKENLKKNDVVSADPKLLTYKTWQDLQEELLKSNIFMTGSTSTTNIVDVVWEADKESPRPEYGTEPVTVYPTSYAGISMEEKLAVVRADMAEVGAEAAVVTALDEVAWLLNIRGNDVQYNPVVRAYVLVEETKVTLYVDKRKIIDDVIPHLKNIIVKDYDLVFADLEGLPPTVKVLLPKPYTSSLGCSYAIYSAVEHAEKLPEVPPTLIRKAAKNEVEISKMRVAQLHDSVALCDFLAFLESEMDAGKQWTELSAQTRLTQFRAAQEGFKDLSFAAISSYGPHAAMNHYVVTPETDIPIGKDSTYLLDSGAQYLGGSTDVTRTMHYGTPTAHMIEMYTNVLMGYIDYGTTVFPQGLTKAEHDILARSHIYTMGLDYRHGTGHGVGMYLYIHEAAPDDYRIGYAGSDEPGYYKDNEWGVRLESIMTVVPAVTEYTFDKDFYTMEIMTLVPFEHKLINMSMLTHVHCKYLNEYNAEIREKVGKEMQKQGLDDGYAWLKKKTEPYCPDSDNTAAGITLPVTMLLAALVAVLASARC